MSHDFGFLCYNEQMQEIITIGSITRDVFLDASNLPLAKVSDFPLKSGILLPFGEKVEIKKIYFTIGGNSANAAVTFARQGLKTACVGNIGNDPGGKEIIKKLKKEKIKTNLIVQSKKLPTAYSVLLLNNGERTILNYHGASNEFRFPFQKTKELLAKWWYLSLAGNSYKFFKQFVSFASKNKIALAFNPSGYHLQMDKEEILKSLKLINFLVLNQEEAATLTNSQPDETKTIFQKLNNLTPNIFAITSGKGGVIVSDKKFIYQAGTFSEKKLIDRTGAGDAFGSGFVAALIKMGFNFQNIKNIQPQHIKEAIRVASANATSVVEHLGATEGILKTKELQNKRFKNLKITITKIY